MDFKFCPKCGRELDKSYNFCPECGFDLADAEEKEKKSLEEKILEQQKKEAYEQFRKSVLEVAEAFFAMSKEEQEAMVEYVQDRCDEAEAEAKAIQENNKHKN